MNRRDLFRFGFAAALSADGLGSYRPKVGTMSIDRWFDEGWHSAGYRTYLDGKDIGDVCNSFDDVRGEAVCLVLDKDGKAQLSEYGDGVLWEVRRGAIEVRRG
jgi:hypothetical protein